MPSPTAIPLIDFAGVRTGDPAALERVGREIRDACTTIGFFYIVNHGVPQPVIDAAESAARKFFAFPVDTKRRAAVNHRHRGFNSLGDATMYQAKRPDYKEFFSIGLELPEDDPDVQAGQALRGPNNWPDFMPELRPALYGYYEAIGECGSHLLRAVAKSLGIDENFFASRYTKRMQRTQMVYYPPQPPQSDDDQFGVAPAHRLRLHHAAVAGSGRRAASARDRERHMDRRAADPRQLRRQRRRFARALD